jgi:dinuclear metal center YbgI/SA1388 family protein
MGKQTIQRDALEKHLAMILDINRFRDYCPNGLQVEGQPVIGTLVTGVTASRALIEAAIDRKADAILVHHGYFWRNEDQRIIGPKHQRLKLLLSHDINLLAYHLPLDAHPELGNNAQLAKVLQLQPDGRFGENDLGWLGQAMGVATVGELAARIEKALGRTPLVIGDMNKVIGRIGWCTGAAQGFLVDAIAAGAATYLSGEISESTVHLARETGTTYISCGHHATERYGIKALGDYISAEFGTAHYFIDIANPV